MVLKGESSEWNYKTGLGQFHCMICGKSSFPFWTNGGIILASFRNSEDWETIKSELPRDSVRLLLGVQCVHPKDSWVKVVMGMLYMCVLTCHFLTRLCWWFQDNATFSFWFIRLAVASPLRSELFIQGTHFPSRVSASDSKVYLYAVMLPITLSYVAC